MFSFPPNNGGKAWRMEQVVRRHRRAQWAMDAVQSEAYLGFSEPGLCEVWEGMEEGDCTSSTFLEVSGGWLPVIAMRHDLPFTYTYSYWTQSPAWSLSDAPSSPGTIALAIGSEAPTAGGHGLLAQVGGRSPAHPVSEAVCTTSALMGSLRDKAC